MIDEATTAQPGDACPKCSTKLLVGCEGDPTVACCPHPSFGGCGTWWPTGVIYEWA